MDTAQEVSNILIQLNYDAEVMDANYVLVKNYIIPKGWSKRISDILFEIPPDFPSINSQNIYGVLVPHDLVYDKDSNVLNAGWDDNAATIQGEKWTRLSFYSEYSGDFKEYLSTHLINTNKILSFKHVE